MTKAQLRDRIHSRFNSPTAEVAEYLRLLSEDIRSTPISDLRGKTGQEIAAEIIYVLCLQDYAEYGKENLLADVMYFASPLEVDPNNVETWRELLHTLSQLGNG
jgi:hypothetical protein